ncbi:hypothetical protein FPSE_00153 [Fusarium pseudograminearum CS3096]|uniref:Uncharacterized protein n=1 Tax=Fusarium pseudograminearum (strain CS3096) TaxID=1028729 RepID=K3VVB5_FUSPC|nr:hypothetical protein FPSE_00153 [Fusarium pseudograminearum CS3096]EKJ79699.1 hypothetical protein FPSE_00153 [Fusarium pseudograminearum CS3096]
MKEVIDQKRMGSPGTRIATADPRAEIAKSSLIKEEKDRDRE